MCWLGSLLPDLAAHRRIDRLLPCTNDFREPGFRVLEKSGSFLEPKFRIRGVVLVLVLENPDRFAIRLTEQISCRTSVSLRSRDPCTEDEHDDEDDSKFRNLG